MTPNVIGVQVTQEFKHLLPVFEGRSVAEEINERVRLIALTLDELRTVVFKTSVAYARALTHSYAHGGKSIQEAEWNRAAALRDALEDLGYTREAELIGGAA